MIDIHTHILYGVDDGLKTIEESIETLRKAKEVGFEKIILTPHYIEGTNYGEVYKDNLIKYNKLKKELKKQKIDIEIILGNEIYASDNLIEKIKNKESSTLGNSNYILVEFSSIEKLRNIEEQVHNIKVAGYIPVIAHIERYYHVYDNIEVVDTLRDMGAIIQVNAYSFINRYGSNAKKIAKKLLKKDKIDILSTDCHSIEQYNELYIAKKKINKMKKDSFDNLFSEDILNI